MAERVTTMVLKVDLQCRCCHQKIKKILCQFPEIRDMVYNVEANTITINVVSCDPVEVRSKLIRKGRKVIDGVEIKKPEKKEPEKKPEKKEPEKKPEKKEPEKKKDDSKPDPKPDPQPVYIPAPGFPMMPWCWKCYQVYGGGQCRCHHGYGYPAPPPACSCGCGGYGYGYAHGNAHRGGFCHYNEESSQYYCSIM